MKWVYIYCVSRCEWVWNIFTWLELVKISPLVLTWRVRGLGRRISGRSPWPEPSREGHWRCPHQLWAEAPRRPCAGHCPPRRRYPGDTQWTARTRWRWCSVSDLNITFINWSIGFYFTSNISVIIFTNYDTSDLLVACICPEKKVEHPFLYWLHDRNYRANYIIYLELFCFISDFYLYLYKKSFSIE